MAAVEPIDIQIHQTWQTRHKKDNCSLMLSQRVLTPTKQSKKRSPNTLLTEPSLLVKHHDHISCLSPGRKKISNKLSSITDQLWDMADNLIEPMYAQPPCPWCALCLSSAPPCTPNMVH